MVFEKNPIKDYSQALDALDKAGNPSDEQILSVLFARDAVDKALKDNEIASLPNLNTLVLLDERLKIYSQTIGRRLERSGWRDSLLPANTSWWWYFKPNHEQKGFDLVLGALVVLLVTISISLMADITNRIFSGGADAKGAFWVICQSLLATVVIGGTFTKTGREISDRLMATLRIPADFWIWGRFLFATSVFLIFLGIYFWGLSRMAVFYKNSGLEHRIAGRLGSAQRDLERAIRISPDYPAAHYDLGSLFEELQDFDSAQREYQLAVLGGLDAAYNNLGRLYLLEHRYSDAASLFTEGLTRAEDNQVRYDLLKNLGWARLGQKRFQEAEDLLRSAIALDSEQASAYCLLAQVLDGQSKAHDAKPEWEKCLAKAGGKNPDEDAWIGLAKHRLNDQMP